MVDNISRAFAAVGTDRWRLYIVDRYNPSPDEYAPRKQYRSVGCYGDSAGTHPNARATRGSEADHVFGDWQTRLFDNLLTLRAQKAVADIVSFSDGSCFGRTIDVTTSDDSTVDSAFDHFDRRIANKLRR